MMDLTAANLVLPHVPREARHAWGIRRGSQCPIGPTHCEFNGPRGRVTVKPVDGLFVVTVVPRKRPTVTVTVDGPGIVAAVNAAFGIAS